MSTKKWMAITALLACLVAFADDLVIMITDGDPNNAVDMNNEVAFDANLNTAIWQPGDPLLVQGDEEWRLYQYNALTGRFMITSYGGSGYWNGTDGAPGYGSSSGGAGGGGTSGGLGGGSSGGGTGYPPGTYCLDDGSNCGTHDV